MVGTEQRKIRSGEDRTIPDQTARSSSVRPLGSVAERERQCYLISSRAQRDHQSDSDLRLMSDQQNKIQRYSRTHRKYSV
jgi:hypothetical protein